MRPFCRELRNTAARTIALLCAQLVQAYYSKARKDGTVQAARVITTTTKPLLDATLHDWASLISYLGEDLATADAQPVAIPETVLPPTPPEPIAKRLGVLRDWWQFYDSTHAAQRPGQKNLGDLVLILQGAGEQQLRLGAGLLGGER